MNDVIARHCKRGTKYVQVKTSPHTEDLVQVTTIAGAIYLVRSASVEFVLPDPAKTKRNLQILKEALMLS